MGPVIHTPCGTAVCRQPGAKPHRAMPRAPATSRAKQRIANERPANAPENEQRPALPAGAPERGGDRLPAGCLRGLPKGLRESIRMSRLEGCHATRRFKPAPHQSMTPALERWISPAYRGRKGRTSCFISIRRTARPEDCTIQGDRLIRLESTSFHEARTRGLSASRAKTCFAPGR